MCDRSIVERTTTHETTRGGFETNSVSPSVDGSDDMLCDVNILMLVVKVRYVYTAQNNTMITVLRICRRVSNIGRLRFHQLRDQIELEVTMKMCVRQPNNRQKCSDNLHPISPSIRAYCPTIKPVEQRRQISKIDSISEQTIKIESQKTEQRNGKDPMGLCASVDSARCIASCTAQPGRGTQFPFSNRRRSCVTRASGRTQFH